MSDFSEVTKIFPTLAQNFLKILLVNPHNYKIWKIGGNFEVNFKNIWYKFWESFKNFYENLIESLKK